MALLLLLLLLLLLRLLLTATGYYYFIPIAAGRSAWRSGSGSALHRCFSSTKSRASSATNTCKRATYSSSQESVQVYIVYTTRQLDELAHS